MNGLRLPVGRGASGTERKPRRIQRRVSAGSILDGILARRNTTGGRYAAIPWFTVNPDGSPGMGRRQCTSEYKLTPIRRKIRELLGVTARIPLADAVDEWIRLDRQQPDLFAALECEGMCSV